MANLRVRVARTVTSPPRLIYSPDVCFLRPVAPAASSLLFLELLGGRVLYAKSAELDQIFFFFFLSDGSLNCFEAPNSHICRPTGG